jgi:ABC-type dipeptide/oligopeptide/nickel transport system ATPase component
MNEPHVASAAAPVLLVEDLRVAFPNRDGGYVEAVRGVSFQLGRERLGIVGESGSGKSQTGRAILGLTAPEGRVTAQRLQFHGTDLLHCSPRQRRELRGGRIAMVLQDPKFSLNPVMTIGDQIIETLQAHSRVSGGIASRCNCSQRVWCQRTTGANCASGGQANRNSSPRRQCSSAPSHSRVSVNWRCSRVRETPQSCNIPA